MKRFLLLLAFSYLIFPLFADELVLIRIRDHQKLEALSNDGRLTLNYSGQGFVIATLHQSFENDYILLEPTAWEKGQAYFLIIAQEGNNREYRSQVENMATILFQDPEIMFIKANEQQLQQLEPPVNGSLTRILNHKVTLPKETKMQASAGKSTDPFIVARMAEVNTTLIQSNIQHLQDYGTRNAYTAQSVQAQNWIKLQFENMGLSTTLFDFTMPSGSASDNVIATKTGTLYPNEYVVIGGHYDSYTGSSSAPGADDNASGTCGVLEVARILAPYTFDRTIIFCAFSGEEYGLYGSAAYATYCDNLNMDIIGYLNMDMVGYLEPSGSIHTDMIAPTSAQWLVDFYTTVVSLYLPTFTVTPGTLTGGDSDHTSFNNHGYMGIFPFEDSQNYSPYIHTANDVMGTSVNSMEQVGVFTKAMVATTISLANLVPPQAVRIHGTVTDFVTGAPIAGATVQVVNTSITPAVTNAAGGYTFINVETGFQTLRVSKIGYATVQQTVTITTTDTIFNFQLQESPAWSFETGVFESFWTFAGNSPWTISTEAPYDGLYCSKSGVIDHSQSSEMSLPLNVTSAGYISFFRKVSSESGYDYLKFYIDGVQQGQWSGTVAWGEVNYAVTAGLHTFKWVYSKDGSAVSGSDCAWVDYIIFPPYGPIPEPANIVVNPSLFNISVGLNGVHNDGLMITNTGESDLTFTATVEYSASPGKSSATVYPLNANYNTGSTTSSAFTETSLVKGYPTTQAGWMKFDVSSIPDGSTINSVEFHGYVNATNYPYWNINPVTANPLTATPSALYTDIMAESAAGYYLYRSETSTYAPGWKTHILGGAVNANLQSALSQDGFTIGIMDRDNSSTYFIGFDGWNQANKPYLVVDYTYVPAYTWLKVNGLGTTSGTILPGNNLQIPVDFDASSLAAGTYTANIRISSNDPDQSIILIPCTLTISADRNLQISLFLEELYQGGGLMRKAQDASGDHFNGTVADQVNIELHDALDYSNIVYTAGNVDLNTNGTLNLQIPAIHSGSYFITVKHRNSIETTTSSPVNFSGSTIIYDFSTAITQAYGNNLLLSGGKFLLYGGDVNQDGNVDSGDVIVLLNDASAFTNGYISSDVNGDGLIDASDMIIVDNNASRLIQAILP
ncbi:MAG: M28 family peptidase [Bacteroidales bacterium]|nr:M28 family peptidase [Bacteroidales bacterium]